MRTNSLLYCVWPLFLACFLLLFLGVACAGTVKSGKPWKKVATDTGRGWKGSSFLVTDDGRRLALQGSGRIVWRHKAGKPDTGDICGRPVIARSNDSLHPWIVVAGNGCNSTTGKARVVVADLANGKELAAFDFDQKGKNGICSLTLVDDNGDGRADRGYGGDLQGNIWKFLLAGSRSQWKAAAGPLFTASFAGYRQPITAAPNVFRHCARPGVLVCFGTGRFLDESDSQDNRQQSLYVIWDRGDANWRLGTFDAAAGVFDFPVGSVFSSATLLEHRLENVSGTYRTGTDFLPVWWKEDKSHKKAHLGWFVNLPGIDGRAGERITSKVLVRAGILFASSFVPESGAFAGKSAVFALRACAGGVLSRPVFDANADGKIDEGDCVNGSSLAAKILSGTFQDMALVEKNGRPALRLNGKSGGIEEIVRVRAPREGMYFWQQLEGN